MELAGVVGVEELVGVVGRGGGPVVGVVGQWREWSWWWVWWVMGGWRVMGGWWRVAGRRVGVAGRCDGSGWCAGAGWCWGRVGSGRLVLILSCAIALNALWDYWCERARPKPYASRYICNTRATSLVLAALRTPRERQRLSIVLVFGGFGV